MPKNTDSEPDRVQFGLNTAEVPPSHLERHANGVKAYIEQYDMPAHLKKNIPRQKNNDLNYVLNEKPSLATTVKKKKKIRKLQI